MKFLNFQLDVEILLHNKKMKSKEKKNSTKFRNEKFPSQETWPNLILVFHRHRHMNTSVHDDMNLSIDTENIYRKMSKIVYKTRACLRINLKIFLPWKMRFTTFSYKNLCSHKVLPSQTLSLSLAHIVCRSDLPGELPSVE